jgi:hypothetical protein
MTATATVTKTWHKPDGTAQQGSVVFRALFRLTDAAAGTDVPAATVTATLDPNGHISQVLYVGGYAVKENFPPYDQYEVDITGNGELPAPIYPNPDALVDSSPFIDGGTP